MTPPRTTLLIPCYNEVDGIPHLCSRLLELVQAMGKDGEVEVLFVDDGSTDGTADAIRREAVNLPFRILSHGTNQGLGASLRRGFSESLGSEVVTLDSDCTYDPLQVLDLLHALRQGNDVVTGSPYHPDGNVDGLDRWRLLVSKSLSLLYWIILPVRLYTYTSCFRAYRRDVLRKLEAKDDGFVCVTQLLVSAILEGARVAEVPTSLTSRRFGRSKLRTIQVGFSHMRYLLHVVRLRFGGAYRQLLPVQTT